MADITTHAVVAPAIGGIIAAAIGAIFHITPDVLFAAFIGAFIGTVLLETLTFGRAISAIIIGTVFVGYAIPIVHSLWPNFAPVSLAFLSGFVIVYFHVLVLKLISDVVKRVFAKVGS